MNYKIGLLTALVVAVSACGGGGDGGSSGGSTSPTPTVVINTGAVADNVATRATSAGSISLDLATGVVPLSVNQSGQGQNTFNLIDFTRQLLHLGHSHFLQPLADYSCSGGGNMTGPDPNATSGTITFNNCGELGLIINGSASFSRSGDPNANYSASITYSNLTLSGGGNMATLNASMTMNGSYNGVSDIDTINVSYSNFKLTVNADYVSLYNYNFSGTYNNTTLAYTVSWDYTFDSSLINGVVHVATENLIQGNDSISQYPSTGSLLMTGANNTSARVSINNTTSVTITADLNGDGSYEYSKTMLWADFDNASLII